MTANAPFAIATCGQPLLHESVTNARLETLLENVLFVVARESPMLIIVMNVRCWKRIEMGVRKLLIWDRVEVICGMKNEKLDNNSSSIN